MNGVYGKNDLSGPLTDPGSSWYCKVSLETLFADTLKGSLHYSFNLKHPLFDVTLLFSLVYINCLIELNLFSFGTDHTVDLILITEHDSVNALETFVHMRLHSAWLFGLGQEHQQVLVCKEIESGED